MATNSNELSLSNISKRIGNLPLLPSVICDLMLLNSSSNKFFETIESISKNEPALAVRVLQIVNSSQSSLKVPITDISQAIIRIGADEILSYVTTSSVMKVFTPRTLEQRNLWRHSIETANFSEHIAKVNPSLGVDPSLAYTCGLLHDIGRFVLLNVASKSIEFVDSKSWDTPLELSDTESLFFGFNHAEVGCLASKRWELPAVITQVIKQHHNYDKVELCKSYDNFKNLLNIIQIADFMSIIIEKNAHWQDFDHQQLLDEIQNNCISKVNLEFTLDTDDLINTIPLIVSKSNESMMKLKLA